jgi:hypothetical protein
MGFRYRERALFFGVPRNDYGDPRRLPLLSGLEFALHSRQPVCTLKGNGLRREGMRTGGRGAGAGFTSGIAGSHARRRDTEGRR